MMVEFYFGGKNDKSDELIKLLCDDGANLGEGNLRAVFAQFLLNPYKLNQKLGVVLGSTLNIDGLARPKFLSDQLAVALLAEHSVNAGANVDIPRFDNLDPLTKIHAPKKIRNKNYTNAPGLINDDIRSDDNLIYDQTLVARYRRNTVLARNLAFIANLYRTVRLKLQQDLTYDKEIIQTAAAITKNSITEFFGHEQFEERDNEDWIQKRRQRYGY
jgi:hypothetical protein